MTLLPSSQLGGNIPTQEKEIAFKSSDEEIDIVNL